MTIPDFKTLTIGYAPLSQDFSEPGDRRRFCSYAAARGFQFSIADPARHYDIVYLTYNCDIPAWIRYKQQYGVSTRLIFELVDSYLFENNTSRAFLRGIGKFVTGKSSRLYLNYKKAIIEICRLADAVVCSTMEQQAFLRQFNNNVHLSLDVFDNEVSVRKTNYHLGSVLKLVWEGQPYTMNNILSIASVLNDLKNKIELHVVSDEHYYFFSKHYLKCDSRRILRKLKCPVIFHPWHKESFSRNICDADLAIIPIDLTNRLAISKPENKLILLWRMGVPVITSVTPAYQRVMNQFGLDMMCHDSSEWAQKIEDYLLMESDQRRVLGDRILDFSMRYYHRDKMFDQWDRIMNSVIDNLEKD
ncbi:MAG: hypothetical protein KBA26_08775 [Candidatus Delongbacteria bacterium]|nr:hypothetical protein [Candidatus Delongbacteria bacterium]